MVGSGALGFFQVLTQGFLKSNRNTRGEREEPNRHLEDAREVWDVLGAHCEGLMRLRINVPVAVCKIWIPLPRKEFLKHNPLTLSTLIHLEIAFLQPPGLPWWKEISERGIQNVTCKILEILNAKMLRKFRQSTRKNYMGRNVPNNCSCWRYVSKDKQEIANSEFWLVL